MSQIIEKLDAIEAANLAKIAEVTEAAKAEVEAAKAELTEKVAALEAKVAAVQAPQIIKAPTKSVIVEANRAVKDQLKAYFKDGGRMEKELKLFEDEAQYAAYMVVTVSVVVLLTIPCLLLCVWLTLCATFLAPWLLMVLPISSALRRVALALPSVMQFRTTVRPRLKARPFGNWCCKT
jgi:hypothetical protein